MRRATIRSAPSAASSATGPMLNSPSRSRRIGANTPPGRSLRWRKIAYYEIVHQWRAVSLANWISYIISLGGFIIISFGDTEQFIFRLKDQSIIDSLKALLGSRWPQITALIAITITFIFSNRSNKREQSELQHVVTDVIVPNLSFKLDMLLDNLRKEFKLSREARACVFVPVRNRVLSWRLRMMSRSLNVPEKETKTNFALDEGIIGLVFLRTETNNVEVADLRDRSNQTYRPLEQSNEILIRHDLKGVLAACTVSSGFSAAIISIDTSNANDIPLLFTKDVHDCLLDWIDENSKALHTLWKKWDHGK